MDRVVWTGFQPAVGFASIETCSSIMKRST
jgi:hypothetical protein